MLWKTIDTDDIAAANLVERLSLRKVLAELLVQRDITTPEAAEEFLRPRLAQLDNPFAVTHLEAAVERIEQAVEGRESVVIFGDYDVDGVTSTVQLVSMLRTLDLEPRYSVPR